MKVLLVQLRDVAQNYIPTRPLLGQAYLVSALRKKLIKEFIEESEKYMIKNLISKYLGKFIAAPLSEFIYLAIQNKHIRKIGIFVLNKSNVF